MDDDTPRTLVRGLVLRSLLVTMIRRHGAPMTVRELCAELERHQIDVPGRPSKVVSDGLRWECRRGRVVQVGRGTYRVGHLARSTAWRMRRRIDHL